jgi:hypothetical protein
MYPIIEIVCSLGFVDVILCAVLSGDDRFLASPHAESGATGRSDLPIATPNGHMSLVRVGIGVDPVFTGALDRICHVGGIDFDRSLQPANVNVERTLG